MPFVISDRPQHTLLREASFTGVGLHTGNKCRLVFCPAPEDTGVVWVRTDLKGSPELKADHRIVTSVIRGTTLSLSGSAEEEARVHTVEHVLAALVGCGVDNVRVELNANEPPVADGSALPFVEVLQKAGLHPQEKPRRCFRPEPLTYEAGQSRYTVEPADRLELHSELVYDHPFIGQQAVHFVLSPESFLRDIAPARTFCFDYEVEALRQQGLARGGSLDNAVVVGMDRVHNKEKSLRFPDEFVRHKTLDLLGDLSLLGMPLLARVTAVKLGHGHNVNLVKRLAAQMESLPSTAASF